MASRRRRIASAIAAWFAGNLLWGLAAPGVGLAVSAVVTAVVDLAQPWRSFFFAGLLMAVGGVILGVVRPLVASYLPQGPPPDPRSVEAAERGERRAAMERAAIHEVISTLEYHKADVERWTKARSPTYQGEWPENRKILAKDPRYDRALRATEKAFRDLPYFVGEAAIAPIDEAIAEWETLLEPE